MFRLRLAILGAAAALALGTAGAMAMQGVDSNNDSHGDAVASAARNCAHGPHGVHGACVSSVARTEGQENSGQDDDAKSSTAPGQVCKSADTDTTETAPTKGNDSAKNADKTEDRAEQQAFVACVKAHAAAESGS
ncbi:MAG TPA: hypothetical protein VGX22_04330 [Candidatus Dormibacteraeota bacterium]|nr:hypothetical protein [Candidatus Dormibacteraeota bacterium]